MSEVEVLNAEKRSIGGKGPARALRREDKVPCVVYGDNKEPVMVALPYKEVMQHCMTPGFYNKVFDLAVEGDRKVTVLPKMVQYHPVTSKPLHVDFLRVNQNAQIRLHVPLEFINEDKSPALKLGGVLNIVYHTIEVFCSPLHIPEKFEIDLAGAQMGKNFTAGMLDLPEGCRFTHTIHAESVIANIVQPQKGDAEQKSAAEDGAENATA